MSRDESRRKQQATSRLRERSLRRGDVTRLSVRAYAIRRHTRRLIARYTHAAKRRRRKPVCTHKFRGLVWIRLVSAARFSKYRKVMKYRERRETFNARSGGCPLPLPLPPSSPFLALSSTVSLYIEYTWPYKRGTLLPSAVAAAWGGAGNFFIKKVFRNKNQTLPWRG